MDLQLIAPFAERRTNVGKQLGIDIFLTAGDQDRYEVSGGVGREPGGIGTASLTAFDQAFFA